MPPINSYGEMAENAHTTFRGLLEKIAMKAIARLSFNASNQLRVEAAPTGTFTVQPASGAVFSMSYGLLTNTASTYQDSMNSFQAGFRRNLVKT